jgi:hypothetical protein
VQRFVGPVSPGVQPEAKIAVRVKNHLSGHPLYRTPSGPLIGLHVAAATVWDQCRKWLMTVWETG